MATDPPAPPAAGWFPDPTSRHQHRYFDGYSWTDHVANAGVQDTDPYKPPAPAEPPPPPPPSRSASSFQTSAPTDDEDRGQTDPTPAEMDAAKPSRKPWKIAAGAAAALLVALIVAVIASPSNKASNDDDADAARAAATTTTPPRTDLDITYPADDLDVHRKSITLKGTALPGSTLTVNDDPPEGLELNGDGTWSIDVDLDRGENFFRVAATAPGHSDGSDSVVIVRKRTAEEIEAAREKRRIARAKAEQRRIERAQRREAARQQRIADFKNSATTIPYNQLAKDPDRYVGEKVTYTGKILQIQEDEGIGGVMLLYVTDEGYDFWDDIVWVDYDRSIRSAEDDVITIYGTVTGEKSYETQIGGETYVPQVHAKYIEEP